MSADELRDQQARRDEANNAREMLTVLLLFLAGLAIMAAAGWAG